MLTLRRRKVMFDQSFTYRTLAHNIKKYDIFKYPDLRNEDTKRALIDKAVIFSETSQFWPEHISTRVIKGNTVYKVNNFYQELILRKCNENIKKNFKFNVIDRDRVVSQLISLLKEQISFSIYRLDIFKFYESICKVDINDILDSKMSVNYRTRNTINNFLTTYKNIGGTGVPRGIELSATLSELIMKDFDNYLERHDNVFYYARFVDDIIIITDSNENNQFIQNIESKLPQGLEFNTSKDKKYKAKIPKGKLDKEKKFSYLGYSFILEKCTKYDIKNDRKIKIDISKNKTEKIKTRLNKSFANFEINGDKKLLLDRVKLLTSNYSLLDKKKNLEVMSGIYYNYKRVNHNTSESLLELDLHLKKLINSNIKFTKNGTHKVSSKQKVSLLKYSFYNGFKHKIKVNFTPSRQNKLQRTWKDDK